MHSFQLWGSAASVSFHHVSSNLNDIFPFPTLLKFQQSYIDLVA